MQARKAIALRTQMVKKVHKKEREAKEDGLRKLAEKAREERAGIRVSSSKGGVWCVCVTVRVCVCVCVCTLYAYVSYSIIITFFFLPSLRG